MTNKICNPEYLAKALVLKEEEKERLLSRMSGKLPRRLAKEKLTVDEALAIQLEIEDEQLAEWREKMHSIKAKEQKKKEKAAEQEKPAGKAESVKPKAEKSVAAKSAKAEPAVEKPVKPAKTAAPKPAAAKAPAKPKVTAQPAITKGTKK